MGLAKREMMEAEESQWEETSAIFTCPECGDKSDGAVEIPVIDKDFSDDKYQSIQVDCISCNKHFDAIVSLNSTQCIIVLDDYPETPVTFEPVFFDRDWEEEQYFFQRPDNPFSIFQDAHRDVLNLIRQLGNDDGANAINRMVFAQSFSMFEAFLCDAYLNLVFFDKNNQKTFMKQHNKAKDLSVSISDLLAHGELSADEIVKKELTQVIKKILFHNLPRAASLFRIYKIDVFPDTDQKALLFKAVEFRHHCVHRNGRDLDGNELDIFTKAYNLKIVDAMMASAVFIEENITRDFTAKLDF